MRATSAVVQFAVAAVLLALGVVSAFATYAHFLPCWHADWSNMACLDAMDNAAHIGILQLNWLWALALTVLALIFARGRAARVALAIAVGIILVMNYLTEYAIWLATYDTADVAPGTGYSMAGATVVAGILVAVSATLALTQNPAEEQRLPYNNETPLSQL